MSSDETHENTPESSVEELIDEFLIEEGFVIESLMQEIIDEFLIEEGLIDESLMEEDLTNESLKEEESPIEEDLINESYWPRLREILVRDPSGMDRLGLECMICMMPMIINPRDASDGHNTVDHRAMVLLCGHIVGFSCIFEYFSYRQQHSLPYACPLHAKPPLCHSECGCGHTGWPMPGKVEDFFVRPLTIAEGLSLAPECIGCTIDDMFRRLTILTNIFEPDFAELLESSQIAYRIRVKHLIWGEFEDDERASHEIRRPISMLQHYRSIERSLITMYSAPGQLLRVGDVEVGLFLYDEPVEHGRVMRRKMWNRPQESTATSDETTDETGQNM
ncbi:hypothetical protein CEP54_005077 [Fusarium duplospermum]|uniref:RING-type domain-containing protein n=1 Tax=Fusarium duplospermum TaxID=1325734 RepID=A0A428QEU0_9HYPO|nr:hypothetical protein CEP54_005077 [Fusarium duplospermum]